MASPAGVVTENVSSIKQDPENYTSPMALDEDIYEDTGELAMGLKEGSKAWLAKVPASLWMAWSQLDEDQPIHLGVMRVYNHQPGEDESNQKIKLMLRPDLHCHSDIPKQYHAKINSLSYNNTCVFSEKDQPGYKNRKTAEQKRENIPYSRSNYSGVDKQKRYKTSIPKQTSLVGFAISSITATPVENAEFRRYNEKVLRAAMQKKKTAGLRIDDAFNSSLNATNVTNNKFATFVRQHQTSKGPKRKPVREKAVRIPENQLIDALISCFRTHNYWSLKALRQHLDQPTAYIKSVLERIATLVRSGPFAMNYMLNPEFKASLQIDMTQVKDEAAKVESGAETDVESEEDLEMEDVGI
ncbi:hypothetical protein LTR66_006504 [Elasticomyces elasticus]|nr:hypothetical protein LTR50_007092 [Elasticomyces elasticus]KAK4991603.1 hypothetical protein LTR66_006504 [Elasticomyces elasticus]